MREIGAKITSKGQVTIPREVRTELGVHAGEYILFVIDDGDIRVKPVRHTLESIRASLPPLPGASDDFDREIEEAMEEEADRIMQRLQRP